MQTDRIHVLCDIIYIDPLCFYVGKHASVRPFIVCKVCSKSPPGCSSIQTPSPYQQQSSKPAARIQQPTNPLSVRCWLCKLRIILCIVIDGLKKKIICNLIHFHCSFFPVIFFLLLIAIYFFVFLFLFLPPFVWAAATSRALTASECLNLAAFLCYAPHQSSLGFNRFDLFVCLSVCFHVRGGCACVVVDRWNYF